MLSLIPAILLLAFHGPSAVERFGDAGRLPEALRALERVWTPQESNADESEGSPSLQKQRKAFASLAALAADPAFSKAVSELFELEWDSNQSDPTDQSDRSDHTLSARFFSEEAVQKGFAACRRTRDGPFA